MMIILAQLAGASIGFIALIVTFDPDEFDWNSREPKLAIVTSLIVGVLMGGQTYLGLR